VTLAAENAEYVSLMRGVELVMTDPGSHDLPVSRIFTHDMFLDLRQDLADQVHYHPDPKVCSVQPFRTIVRHLRPASGTGLKHALPPRRAQIR
jgi:hypothetical protein